MKHEATGVAWATEVELAGPLSEVAFLDATWQGAPVWRDTDAWVATDADLAYDGPPWSGLLIRLHAAAGERISVFILGDRPVASFHRVFSSELIVGGHGFVLETDDASITVPVPEGNYPVVRWVDGESPATTTRCVITLGPRTPRRLETPRV